MFSVSLETDPYDETEKNLKKCGVLESSVWELRVYFLINFKLKTKNALKLHI